MNKTNKQKVEEVVEKLRTYFADDKWTTIEVEEAIKQELTSLLNQRDAEVIEMIEGMIEKDGECSCASYKEPLQDIIKGLIK